jgi:hypothetical protein
MLGRVLRIILSLGISVVPLLYLADYLSFIPGLPTPAALLGSFGLTGANGFFDLAGGGAGTGVPLGTFGVTGFIAYELLSRVGRTVSSAAMMSTMPSGDYMMKRMIGGMNIPGMMGATMGGPMGGQSGFPQTLPPDLTKSQFVILRSHRQGYRGSKQISKALSMDRKEVEAQTATLVTNGYLTKDNKLTAKGLDLLGS